VPGLSYGGLDNYLGYALRRAQLAGFDAFQRAIGRSDMTPARFTAMVIVRANPGLTQSALGAALGTARSGAMVVVDWLEARGLAERRGRSEDARAWGLFLTPRGEARLRELKRRVRANDAAFAARLTADERMTLRTLLEKLAG
jgi:DNA-binding MarR family transcriptional regulator